MIISYTPVVISCTCKTSGINLVIGISNSEIGLLGTPAEPKDSVGGRNYKILHYLYKFQNNI